MGRCSSAEGRRQLLALLLLLRCCVFYVVAAIFYDVSQHEGLQGARLAFGLPSRTLCLLSLCLLALAIMADLCMLAGAWMSARAFFIFLGTSAFVHLVLVLPWHSFGAYVSVAARARDTSLQLDWVQAFGQMRSLCADPSTSTSTDTLPRLLELRRRVAPAERSFGCCGLDAPDDYTARLCPELKQENRVWWADVPEQQLPSSCCTLPGAHNHSELVDCRPRRRFNDSAWTPGPRQFWARLGCQPEAHDFLFRVLLTLNATVLATDLLSLPLLVLFVLVMRKLMTAWRVSHRPDEVSWLQKQQSARAEPREEGEQAPLLASDDHKEGQELQEPKEGERGKQVKENNEVKQSKEDGKALDMAPTQSDDDDKSSKVNKSGLEKGKSEKSNKSGDD